MRHTAGAVGRSTSPLPLLVAASLAFAGCLSGEPRPAASSPPPSAVAPAPASGSPVPKPSAAAASVRLQLQATPRAQFAGYFAADKRGYYEAENLTVEFIAGGPTITPHTVGSAASGPEFTISWVPKVLEAREAGSDLVNIAQVFQRSGTVSVAWKDSGITNACGFAGKRVGVSDLDNEQEVTAEALACGLSPGLELGGSPATTYQKVIQGFDMGLFIKRQIDVAEATIYNEFAQVLETANPATGALYKPEDLTIIDWNKERSAMLQDALFARKSWLAAGSNRDVAVRFVRATQQGWIYCRDHQEECIRYSVEAGSRVPAGRERWMMNEVGALVWPSPDGVGMMDPILWAQTVKIAKDTGVIKADPSADAYTNDIVEEALLGVAEDARGMSFTKGIVAATPGGK